MTESGTFEHGRSVLQRRSDPADSERIDRISHGQLPKELDGQLKRIEKLAKHLRSEVAP